MKSVKIFGLVVLAATTMALGTSSAMAESTTLCKADENPCGEANRILHWHWQTLSGAKMKLLAGLVTVACDVLLLAGILLRIFPPRVILHVKISFSNCGSCTVEELEGGETTIEVLKEGHETAKVTGEGVMFVDCGGEALECEYDWEGLVGTAKGPLLSSETNGSVSITNQVVHKHPGGGGQLCPETSKLDITVTPLSATYITS